MDFATFPYLESIIAIAWIHFVAAVSPGPDFAMTMRNSLVYSRRTGVFSAIGTTCGMCVHLTYTIIALDYLSENAPNIVSIVKYVGSAYLVYIGYKSIRAKAHAKDEFDFAKSTEDLTPFAAFRLGFLTNALNPFVIVLFLGILSNYINSTTPWGVQMIYALEILVITLAWFLCVALWFSHHKIRAFFNRLGHWLERITGGILIGFGLRMAFLIGR